MKNPIYLKNVATLKLNSEKCTSCGICIDVCPHNVFVIKDKKLQIAELDRCMECGACQTNCPTGAVTVDKGVGCATAIIWGFIKGTEPNCDCSGSSSSTCC